MKNNIVIAAMILMCCIVTIQFYVHVFVEHLKFLDVVHRMSITSTITLILWALWSEYRKYERKKKLGEVKNWNPLA